MKNLLSVLLLAGLMLLPAFSQAKKADAKKAAEKLAVLDINTATADQLKTIPGIGDAYSAAIVKGRPYKRKDELVDKKILPQGVYDKVKEQIIAKQK
jgi:DNA uptake protein ComE-like DNA-binding protein